jgi:aminoglycoside phosphotransferase (APT) family kinase protein
MRAAKPLVPVGTGRTADVFAHREGEVIRRYRSPRDTEREVAAMSHARRSGYPVPAARALNETEIVMDRLDGPTMLDDLGRRPWRLDRHARTLVELHRALHRIPAPSWLPAPVGDGRSLLHLDLHPDNVMLTTRGPYVIDWPNAARGPGEADVAHTWLVLACSTPTTGTYRQALSRAGRGLFLRAFLRRVDREAVSAQIATAGAHRLSSRVLPDSELDAIRRMIAGNDP